MYLVITFYSVINGLDPFLMTKIAKTESNLNPIAFSKTKDGGLFQLNTRYHKFHNQSWVFNYTTNTAIALGKIKKLKDECSHKKNNTYLICYNLGVYGAKKIKNAESQTYYKKITTPWRLD